MTTTLIPSKLGEMGQFLLAQLLKLRETGEMPAERNAWESRVFYRRPKRTKRTKNPRTAAARQFAKYYESDSRALSQNE